MTGDKLSMQVVIGEEAKKIISSIRNQYIAILTIGLTYNLVSLILSVTRYIKYNERVYHKWENIVMAKVIPIASMVHIAFAVATYILYYRSIRMQKEAAFSGDQELFNSGLELNKKANYLVIFANLINFVSLLFYFFREVIFTFPS